MLMINCVNTMVGCFKPKLRENWNSLCVKSDSNVAMYHFLEKKGAFVNSFDINTTYYEVFLNKILHSRKQKHQFIIWY